MEILRRPPATTAACDRKQSDPHRQVTWAQRFSKVAGEGKFAVDRQANPCEESAGNGGCGRFLVVVGLGGVLAGIKLVAPLSQPGH